MNLVLEPAGFLGTGASFLADLTLIAYVLLIVPAMIAGYFTARLGYHRPAHKWLMNIVTLVNWLLIIFLMLAAFRTDVAPNLAENVSQPRYFLPGIHTILGLPAQLLATYIVIRMAWEDIQVARARRHGETELEKYWFKAAKWTMRLALVLWLATSLLGVVSYLVRYNVIPLPGPDVPPPAATEDVPAPASTDEVPMPVSTDEVPTPASTQELLAPASTAEVPMPASTPEVQPEPEPEPDPEPEDDDDEDDDDSGQGRGRGRGRGGDDDDNSGPGNADDD